MASIQDLLDQLRNPGEDGVPDSIYDDISNTYNHDIETRDAKISETASALQERESEISALKSANYDLMQATTEDAQLDDSDNEESEDSGIDDLFD